MKLGGIIKRLPEPPLSSHLLKSTPLFYKTEMYCSAETFQQLKPDTYGKEKPHESQKEKG